MKKYGYVYRGRIIAECEAKDWFSAVKFFDNELHLTIMSGDVVLL